MISHEKKFIFIHIPRTGGTNLSDFLLPYCDEESLKFSPYIEKGHLHAPIIDYMEHYGDEVLDYTIFTIVRNPWSRALSQSLKHINGKFEREHFRKTVFRPWDLGAAPHSHFNYLFNRKAVHMLLNARAAAARDSAHIWGSEDRIGGQQHRDYGCKYVPAAEPEMMESVYEQIVWPYFLQFEDYTKDVTYMLDKLDIKYDIEKLKTKTNSIAHRHYSTYFEEDEIEEVRFACGLDLQFFGYEFEKENV